LFTTDDLHEVLAQVLKFTVGAVDGCDCASVTLYRHGRIADTVTSNAVAPAGPMVGARCVQPLQRDTQRIQR
jgi:hypothetical protein